MWVKRGKEEEQEPFAGPRELKSESTDAQCAAALVAVQKRSVP